jgi:hypothetical protein
MSARGVRRSRFMRRILARGEEAPVKHSRRAVVLAAALVLALSGSLAACRRPAADPVRAALDEAVSAARDRAVDRFMDLVAADFRGEDGASRADVESTLRRYFAAYEMLDVELSDVTVERAGSEGGPALVHFTAKLTGQAKKIGGLGGFLPPSSTWRFDARLVDEGGRRKFAWAAWRQVS